MWSHIKGVWKLLLWGNESSLFVLAVPGVGSGRWRREHNSLHREREVRRGLRVCLV